MISESRSYSRSPRDLAWLAGLFEGEGCIWEKRGRPILEIAMTDEDPVRHAHAVAGVGVVNQKRQVTKGGKHIWVWSVGRIEHAVGLAMTLYPMLGERRQKRIRECLDSWRLAPLPRRLRTHCVHGHPLSGENLFVHEGRRRCKVCRRDRSLRYEERKRAAPAL